MIKVEHIETWGFEHAIRGMRNPLNSWERSDSGFMGEIGFQSYIGENDLNLMHRLYVGGQPHRKYLRQIFVSMDITAPLYWWSEFDTYKVGTAANSCSKMHKLLHKPFEMPDFSFDKLPGFKNEIQQFRPEVDSEVEIWRRIDADYDVSNQGRIRHGSRILSGSVHYDNYIFVTLHGKQLPVHRLVAEAFIANPSKKREVNHIDGNKMNNSADNLEWVTRAENQRHAVDTHLQPNATETYKGKFTAEQREEIKCLWDSGKYSRRQLADKFCVSHTCINDIINDKYKYAETVNLFEEIAKPLVDTLNELRDSYFMCSDESSKKQIWYSILQILPESYNQRRTVSMTYENVMNILDYRENHKLDEWREFCGILRELPYIKEIRGENK